MSAKKLLAVLGLLLLAAVPVSAGMSFQDLKARLESSDPAVRLDAVRRLAVEYPSGSLDSFISAATDSDEYVRERAVQALGQSGSERAIPVVLAAAEDPADFVRWRAVQALNNLGVRDLPGPLARLVDDNFWRVRVAAFQLLGQIGRAKLVSSSPELAAAPGGEQIRKLLLAGLDDPDERARLAAARALALVRDSAAYDPLVALLAEGGMFTRDEAALGLGDLGDTRAVAPLIAALEARENSASVEGSDWARWGAAVALRQLTGQDFRINAAKWRDWLASYPPK